MIDLNRGFKCFTPLALLGHPWSGPGPLWRFEWAGVQEVTYGSPIRMAQLLGAGWGTSGRTRVGAHRLGPEGGVCGSNSPGIGLPTLASLSHYLESPNRDNKRAFITICSLLADPILVPKNVLALGEN